MNSLAARLTGDHFFNTNKMLRIQDARIVLMVESSDDVSIIRRHADSTSIRLAPTSGKKNLIAAANKHREAGDDWVIGLVDRDFDDEDEIPENVVPVEAYDIDSHFIVSHPRILRTLLESYLPDVASDTLESARQDIVAAAKVVGCARLASIQLEHGVSFDSFPMILVLNASRDTLDPISAILDVKYCDDDRATEVRKKVISLYPTQDDSSICNGHDLARATAALISMKIGLSVPHKALAASLRAVISCDEFQKSRFAQAIGNWASENHSRDIWICPC
ncbi:DUF4435 domain-containing protein [Luteipulveratus halotolerans]|uniref:DUF4435 domain-containing protein n=1 Tax=Luteipulveratus halotolerans TaxID=1631356 RepID=UPI0008FBC9B2|nr:DUF4435 domain-containing protein [Luteipulveratus halotolerans]